MLEVTENTSGEKFKMFRSKLEKMVIEQDYVSQSENSEDAEDEDHETYDADD